MQQMALRKGKELERLLGEPGRSKAGLMEHEGTKPSID